MFGGILFAVVIICGFEVHEGCRAHGGGLSVLGLLYNFVQGVWGGHVELVWFKSVVVTLSYVKGRG